MILIDLDQHSIRSSVASLPLLTPHIMSLLSRVLIRSYRSWIQPPSIRVVSVSSTSGQPMWSRRTISSRGSSLLLAVQMQLRMRALAMQTTATAPRSRMLLGFEQGGRAAAINVDRWYSTDHGKQQHSAGSSHQASSKQEFVIEHADEAASSSQPPQRAALSAEEQKHLQEAHQTWHVAAALLRDAKNDGDMKEALKVAHKAAEMGELEALLYLADHYIRIEPKPLTARDLASRADGGGHAKAPTVLGCLWMGAGGHPIDVEKAVAHFHRAASAGEPDAAFHLGVYYSGWYTNQTRTPDGWDKVSEADRAKAREFFAQAARAEHDQAMSMFGTMLLQGIGGDADRDEGMRWMQRAAEVGSPEAMFNLGWMLFEHGDLERAYEVFVQAGERGSANGFWNAGLMIVNGTMGKLKLDEPDATARQWMKRAADLGHSHAQFNYARIVQHGFGGETDLAQAREYYAKSAEAQVVPAMYNLGLMMLQGSGGDEDVAAARELFEKAARAGHLRYVEHSKHEPYSHTLIKTEHPSSEQCYGTVWNHALRRHRRTTRPRDCYAVPRCCCHSW